MKKKTFESLPVGTILKEGDVFTLAMDPFRAGTEAMDGNWFRPVEKKKRAIITHDGVEYDAEPVPEPIELMNEKGWADSAAYIEWVKDEIARLREELGEE